MSTNHRTIGHSYLAFGILGFVAGYSESMHIRDYLSLSHAGWYNDKGVARIHYYNSLITSHGVGMIFFFVMPILIGAFGNYLLPIDTLAPDMNLPRLNHISVLLFITSATLNMINTTGLNPSCGWTMYPPLISQTDVIELETFVVSLHLVGLSSILGSVNFICTIMVEKRNDIDTSIYAHSMLITSFLLLVTVPYLAIAITGILLDHCGTHIYDNRQEGKGDPLVYQHLFWFFGHPEVYIVILPVFGLVSRSIAKSTQISVNNQISLIASMYSIGIVSFVVYGHHMFTAGLSLDSRIYYSTATITIGIPTSIKVIAWVSTICAVKIPITPSLIYTYTFLGFFSLGGLSGLALSYTSFAIIFHDTYFVVVHFHYVLSLGAAVGVLIGLSMVLVEVFGVRLSTDLILVQALLLTAGAGYIFYFIHHLGLLGYPRRYLDTTHRFASGNKRTIVGQGMIIISNIVFLINIWVGKKYQTILVQSK